jgi:hypothetical protein
MHHNFLLTNLAWSMMYAYGHQPPRYEGIIHHFRAIHNAQNIAFGKRPSYDQPDPNIVYKDEAEAGALELEVRYG